MLLATLDIRDIDGFLFDISKLAVKSRSATADTLRRFIGEADLYQEHIYMDLRKSVRPQDLARLVNKLVNLNGIIDVHLERIGCLDYSATKVTYDLN